MYGVYILAFEMVIISMMSCSHLWGNCPLGTGVKYLITEFIQYLESILECSMFKSSVTVAFTLKIIRIAIWTQGKSKNLSLLLIDVPFNSKWDTPEILCEVIW